MCAPNSYIYSVDKKTGNRVWHATKYRNYFFENVSKWVRSVIDDHDIELKNHGFAKQLSVMKDNKAMSRKELWFYVDLVPAVEIGKFC